MPVFRITTQEIILRQYVISAPSEAAALEDWKPSEPHRWYDSEPVTNPERIEHIEEDRPND